MGGGRFTVSAFRRIGRLAKGCQYRLMKALSTMSSSPESPLSGDVSALRASERLLVVLALVTGGTFGVSLLTMMVQTGVLLKPVLIMLGLAASAALAYLGVQKLHARNPAQDEEPGPGLAIHRGQFADRERVFGKDVPAFLIRDAKATMPCIMDHAEVAESGVTMNVETVLVAQFPSAKEARKAVTAYHRTFFLQTLSGDEKKGWKARRSLQGDYVEMLCRGRVLFIWSGLSQEACSERRAQNDVEGLLPMPVEETPRASTLFPTFQSVARWIKAGTAKLFAGVFFPVFLTSAAYAVGTKPDDRLAPLKAAADAFCKDLRVEEVRGLPAEAALKRLKPHLTPELYSLIVKARVEQQRQMQKHPDEKPNWIEGDLFGSLFEGVTQWELGSAFSAPGVDATVKVKLNYTEGSQPAVNWTDTLVFKEREGKWLLNDIRMGGEWAFKAGDSLRGRLPGGWKVQEDHDSPDERWHVDFEPEGEGVKKITVQAADKSSAPKVLFGEGADKACPFPSWVLWSPDCDLLAVSLGAGEHATRTRLFRLAKSEWSEVAVPDFYPVEKQTMLSNGFHETDSQTGAEYWQDAATLVVRYFSSWTNGDDGDGFSKFISIRVGPKEGIVVESVDTPGNN